MTEHSGSCSKRDAIRQRGSRTSRRPDRLASSILVAGVAAVLTLAVTVPATAGPAAATGPLVAVGRPAELPAGATLGAPLASSENLHLDVVLESSNPAGLVSFASAVSTPGSPLYRRYLTRDEFASKFGATTRDIDSVERSLRSLGLSPGPPSANRLVIPVSATVDAVQKAFRVQMHHVVLAHKANAYGTSNVPVLPQTVASKIQSVVGLSNVIRPVLAPPHPSPSSPPHLQRPGVPHGIKRNLSASSLGVTTNAAGPAACSSVNTLAQEYAQFDSIYPNSYTMLDSYYGLSSLYSSGDTGAGVTVGVYELAGYTPSDIAAFQSCYGTSATVNTVNVDGGPGAGYLSDSNGVAEAELDIETVIGSAPGATVNVYQGTDVSTATDTSVMDVWNQIVSDDTAKVVSTSWGICEYYQAADPSYFSTENTLFEEAATQGQSILAASGDTGSAGCIRSDNNIASPYASDPASNPWVTGVGGTENTAYTSAYAASINASFPAEEGAWNDGCTDGTIDDSCSAGGGGESVLWSRPTWQTGPGVVNSTYPNSAREVPDVAASADYNYFPYIIYDTDGPSGWSINGGTSAAAPLWAGVLALVDGMCASESAGAIGFANPALYADAAQHPADFSDVTAASGSAIGTPANNDVTGLNAGAYPATSGYDMATGLGSPHGASLAAQLCSGGTATVPGAPTSVSAVAGNADATVTWAAPSSNGGSAVTGYVVTPYLGVSAQAPHPFNTAATSDVITGLANGETYTFTVAATNAIGTGPQSSASPPITVGKPPTAPSNVRARSNRTTTSTGSLTVSYAAGPNSGAPITSFTATCTSRNGGATKTRARNGATAAPITVVGVTTKKTYTCTVTATSAGGTGPASTASAPVIVGAPAAPSGAHSVKVARGTFKVNFSSGSNNGARTTSYRATCTPSNGGVTRTKTGTSSPITVNGLTPGKRYTCTVKATNSRGTGPPSSPSPALTA